MCQLCHVVTINNMSCQTCILKKVVVTGLPFKVDYIQQIY